MVSYPFIMGFSHSCNFNLDLHNQLCSSIFLSLWNLLLLEVILLALDGTLPPSLFLINRCWPLLAHHLHDVVFSKFTLWKLASGIQYRSNSPWLNLTISKGRLNNKSIIFLLDNQWYETKLVSEKLSQTVMWLFFLIVSWLLNSSGLACRV